MATKIDYESDGFWQLSSTCYHVKVNNGEFCSSARAIACLLDPRRRTSLNVLCVGVGHADLEYPIMRAVVDQLKHLNSLSVHLVDCVKNSLEEAKKKFEEIRLPNAVSPNIVSHLLDIDGESDENRWIAYPKFTGDSNDENQIASIENVKFDIVIASLVLHHVTWWKVTLSWLLGLISPNGLFLFSRITGDMSGTVGVPIEKEAHNRTFVSDCFSAAIKFLDSKWKQIANKNEAKDIWRIVRNPVFGEVSNGFEIEDFLRYTCVKKIQEESGYESFTDVSYPCESTVTKELVKCLWRCKGISPLRVLFDSLRQNRVPEDLYFSAVDEGLNDLPNQGLSYNRIHWEIYIKKADAPRIERKFLPQPYEVFEASVEFRRMYERYELEEAYDLSLTSEYVPELFARDVIASGIFSGSLIGGVFVNPSEKEVFRGFVNPLLEGHSRLKCKEKHKQFVSDMWVYLSHLQELKCGTNAALLLTLLIPHYMMPVVFSYEKQQINSCDFETFGLELLPIRHKTFLEVRHVLKVKASISSAHNAYKQEHMAKAIAESNSESLGFCYQLNKLKDEQDWDIPPGDMERINQKIDDFWKSVALPRMPDENIYSKQIISTLFCLSNSSSFTTLLMFPIYTMNRRASGKALLLYYDKALSVSDVDFEERKISLLFNANNAEVSSELTEFEDVKRLRGANLAFILGPQKGERWFWGEYHDKVDHADEFLRKLNIDPAKYSGADHFEHVNQVKCLIETNSGYYVSMELFAELMMFSGVNVECVSGKTRSIRSANCTPEINEKPFLRPILLMAYCFYKMNEVDRTKETPFVFPLIYVECNANNVWVYMKVCDDDAFDNFCRIIDQRQCSFSRHLRSYWYYKTLKELDGFGLKKFLQEKKVGFSWTFNVSNADGRSLREEDNSEFG